MTSRRRVLRAHQSQITSCTCGCGQVHITFFDEAGQPMAVGSYSHRTAIECAGMLVDAADAARLAEIGGDARGMH